MQQPTSFGEQLRRYRELAGLTQEQLAERAGLTAKAVGALERGERHRPYPNTVQLLATALGLSEAQRAALVAAIQRRSPAVAPQAPGPVLHQRSAPRLPTYPTPFVGREVELAMLERLLADPARRLVTLVGAGGIGKTRLALHVAGSLRDSFHDGAWFVELASIQDPELVAAAIAEALGVKEAEGTRLVDSLVAYLRPRRLLLVLDNFEQVIAAAPLVGQLLASAPDLTILVTSREPLHLYAEHEVAVPPLSLPDVQERSAAAVSASEAVALFVQRAQAVQAGFQLTEENAPAVAQICLALDGVPLAIELAAARIKILPPNALLSRLEHRLNLLSGGPRDLPARQQSLRSAIAWSYNLLDPHEQTLFARLAVFAGGFTLEAAEAVCVVPDGLPIDVFDGIASLVDKSLLRQADGQADEPRFSMAETIREYALEQLAERGEVGALRRQHYQFFLALAETVDRQRADRGHERLIGRLEIEHDNLRAALVWSRGESDGELVLRLAAALAHSWDAYGQFAEGRMWLEEALRHADERAASSRAPDPRAFQRMRARALLGAGVMTLKQGDWTSARGVLQQSMAIARAVDDTEDLAWALHWLGTDAEWSQGDFETARRFQEESAALFRALGNKRGLANALLGLGGAVLAMGDSGQAHDLWQESLAISREPEAHFEAASALAGLAAIRRREHDFAGAMQLYEQGLALLHEGNNRPNVPLYLYWIAGALVEAGDLERASAALQESIAMCRDLGLTWLPHQLLSLSGFIARAKGDYGRAEELYAESMELYRQVGDEQHSAYQIRELGVTAAHRGDYTRAESRFEESVSIARELGDIRGEALGQACIAWLYALRQQPEQAVRLFASAQALLESHGVRLTAAEQAEIEAMLAVAREQLSPAAFQSAWAAGYASPQRNDLHSPPPASSKADNPAGLTAREMDVLRLVAQGLTDAQIAERLVISTRTASSHLSSIYGKLGISSRTAAARFAVDHNLL